MKLIKSGVTRFVLLAGPYAIKVPRFRVSFVRGWLANQSEWQQRHRMDVNPPIFTVFHLAAVYRRADGLFTEQEWESRWDVLVDYGYSWEEAKHSSWGRFGSKNLIIDFDRSYVSSTRSRVGQWYFGRQEDYARFLAKRNRKDVLDVQSRKSW